MWAAAEDKDWEQVHMMIAMGCVFAEQVAGQRGSKFRLGWLLTGQEDPPFATVRQLTAAPHQTIMKHARLADPRWVTANLAFMENMAKMEERTDKAEKGVKGGEQEKVKEKDGKGGKKE